MLLLSSLLFCLLFFLVSWLFRKLKTMKEKNLSDNSAPQIKYDVFVSFRVEDIHRSFLTDMTNTFQRKKIKAYVDGKNLKGEAIWPSIVGAIEGSSISVVLFSPGYASSQRCLEELTKILECRVKYGRIVIPVFYNVERTDVLNQSGKYRSPFAKHESKHKSKVQIWRSALEKSAQLSGIESSKIRDDAKLVKKIVNLVLKRLRMVNSEGQVGIDQKIKEVLSLIEEEPKQTRLIGIWGKGGVGKTTLVEEVYNKLQSQYEGCYFLAHETEELSRHGILSLKEKCFSKLLGYDVKIVTPNSLPKDIVTRIASMKVLIVLDDVNDFEHLEKLLGTLSNFGSGSRIIVTTRHLQVLDANKADKKYQLGELSSDEALALFNWNAYNQSDYRREYNGLSESVILYAQGIPLVIKVLAGHLRGKKKEVWQHELDKLEKMPKKKVYDVMKLSYDGLERKEQQIFLDLACFFLRTQERVNAGYLKSLLKDNESDNSIDLELGRLKDKALVTFAKDNFVSMHDNLQQMAWEIVRQESIEDPGKRIRLWNPNETYEALKNVKGIDSIRSILLHWPTIKKEKLSPHIFAKMNRLQFLEIAELYYYNSAEPFDILGANTCWPKWHKARIADILAEGLHFLATELRFLCWYHYPLKSLPENLSAEKLVILKLPNSRMEKLWLGVKNLVNLKEVDLTKSKKLKALPDLSKAINLEVLILRSCSMLTSVHPSIFSPPKLEKLDLRRCESLTILASCSHLHSLSYLNLDFCENLIKFSLISDNMKELRLRCTKVKALPPSSGHQRKLELLHLEESGIERLPSSLSNLTQLLHLDVSFCDKLQTIAELPPFLQNLNVLHCTLLQTIPKLPPSLKTLNAEACTSLETLPELPPSLEILNVESCPSLGTIPELPPSLETLNVQCCHLLRTIPKLPTCLKTLYTKNCTSLQNLPQLPPFLETLNATYCKSLKNVLFPTTVADKLKENRKQVLFWNCSNLDQHSLVAIGLNMKINIIKFVSNKHLSTPDHSHVEDYSDYEYNYHSYQAVYAYPGSNFPEWLWNKTTKDYIIIDLPCSLSSSLAGFIFYFVLGEFQHTDIIRRVEFKITVSDGGGKGEGERNSVRMYLDYWDDTIESDNICVMYDQRCSDFILSRPKRNTSFIIQVTMEARISFGESYYALPQKVLKGFGVSPISCKRRIFFLL